MASQSSKDEERERKRRARRLRARYPDIFATKPVPEAKNAPPVVTTKTCHDCNQPYARTTFTVMGIKMNFDGGRCPKCRELHAAAEAAKSEAARQAAIKAQRKQWWQESGVSGEFILKSFETFEKDLHPRAFDECVKYSTEYPLVDRGSYPSLVIYSEHSWGVGKSHLASSICRRILEKWSGQGVEWDESTYQLECHRRNPIFIITEPDLFFLIRASFNYRPEERNFKPTEEQLISKLTTVPLLVIDDVTKQEVADMKFVQRTWFQILDARYRSGLPIVLTVNKDAEGLRYHLGGGVGNDASFDRLRGMTGGKFIQIEGESYRLKEFHSKYGNTEIE